MVRALISSSAKECHSESGATSTSDSGPWRMRPLFGYLTHEIYFAVRPFNATKLNHFLQIVHNDVSRQTLTICVQIPLVQLSLSCYTDLLRFAKVLIEPFKFDTEKLSSS